MIDRDRKTIDDARRAREQITADLRKTNTWWARGMLLLALRLVNWAERRAWENLETKYGGG